MESFGRCCVVALVLLLLTCNNIRCSPLNKVLPEDISPCFHDCSIKEGFCENGGTCIKLDTLCSATSFSCLCSSGFTGSRCNKVTEPCKHDTLFTDFNCYCENGATCLKISDECAPSSYRCDCRSGFEGALCETPVPLGVLETNPTMQSTESTTSATNPTKSSSPTTTEVMVDSSPGIASSKEVSIGNSSTPATLRPVINVTVSSTEVPPTTKTTITSQITKPAKHPTPGLKDTPLKRLKLSKQTYPQLCFKCVQGQCSENEIGAKCICDPGYYGQYCDSQCSKECLHGGICTYSKGLESCRCDALYEGEFCEKKRVVQTTAPTPLITRESLPANQMAKNIYQQLYGDRFCAANFECIHGVCNSSDHRRPKCLCQEGFIGVFCQTKCAKKCLNKGQCLVVNGTEKCNCPKGYQGQVCEKHTGYVFHSLSIKDRLAVAKPKSAPSQGQRTLQQSHQSMFAFLRRNKSPYFARIRESGDPKQCAANFVCIHGVCDKSLADHPRCICDKGYIGSLCHRKCSLKCANKGVCIVHYGQQRCNCKFGFEGKLCERGVYHDRVKGKGPQTTMTKTKTMETSLVVTLTTTIPSPTGSVVQQEGSTNVSSSNIKPQTQSLNHTKVTSVGDPVKSESIIT